MARKKKIAPKQIYKFYDDKDFQYQMSFVNEFYSNNVTFKIIVYRVDIVKSTVDDIYNESKAKDKKFLPPVELSIVMNSYVVEQNFLSKAGLFNSDVTDFNFSILMSELDNKKVEINNGDFFKWSDGQAERLFKITKVTRINSENTAYGYRPFYIVLNCILSKENIVIE